MEPTPTDGSVFRPPVPSQPHGDRRSELPGNITRGLLTEREAAEAAAAAQPFQMTDAAAKSIPAKDGSRRRLQGQDAAGRPPLASQQPTPCNLNRFVLLVVYTLYVAVSARVLFGWPHLSNMLLHDGAYRWRCEGEPLVEGKRYACTRQDSSIQLLFTLGIGVSFCCSLAAGALLDWGGPKLSACIGQLCSTIGWVLLGMSSEERPLYLPAVFFIAMGADAGYLPSMNIANLFPGYESLVIVVVCSAMSASFSITSIMEVGWRQHPEMSFKSICLMYAGLGSGVCFFVALLVMPVKAYKSQEELTLAFVREGESTEQLASSADEDLELTGEQKQEEKQKKRTSSRAEGSFFTQLWTPHFLLFYIYWPLNALFYNFYLTSAENLFGKDINDLIGILGPVSMVPAILLGFLADRYGVMSLVLFIISSGVCMFAFALMPFRAAHYLSPVFSCLYVSNFSGQMYAYVGDTFRTSDFGRIVGIISITGGLVGFLRMPLNDGLTLKVFKGEYRRTCAVMLGVALLCLLLAVWLFFVKRKQQKAYAAEEELGLTNTDRRQSQQVEMQRTAAEESSDWA
ncbi:hypothetical protein Efla_001142 [Eimeria flavescens]